MSYTPKSFEEFARLATQGNVIPVAKTVAADLMTPVAAYLRLQSLSPYSFLLESIEGGEKVARYSFLGTSPHVILRARGSTVELVRNNESELQQGSFFEVLRRYFNPLIPTRLGELPPFTGGAVGYVGYDAVRWFERVPSRITNDFSVDDALLMFFSTVLAFDHVKQQIVIIANVFTEGSDQDLERNYQQALARIEEIEVALAAPLEIPPKRKRMQPPTIRSNMSKEMFEQAVERAKAYIRAGDIFQVVLSQRFELNIVAHPFQIYRALRMINPSPYMFYLSMNDLVLIGSSPEMLVRCTGRRLDYRPIAGTRPRGTTDVEDALVGEEMRADEKEVAEHVMLVDLGRNDLGRVSDYGSVEVLDLMTVERYSHVMHLVSNLRSRLRAGSDRFDAFSACFPAGTVSGAPKVRAMEIIDELESTRRGPYAGAVLYLDYSSNLDSCIAIRTVVVKNNRAYIQAGAGIVADSIPEKEYIETVNKARALVKAIEIAEKEL
ncbi:MAG: anthranilate synthase component I [Acidobacteriota bacterium]